MSEYIPQYVPTGKVVKLEDCIDDSKVRELIVNIRNSNISKEEKDFLIAAASRHYIFNYSKIADYYANADAKMQELMEDSALVIIDKDNAIANGFAKLSENINKLMEE
jgi:hypothetical protein